MFSSGLKSETWRLVFILIVCAVTGGLSGHFLLFITAGLSVCLLRLLLKIHQLLSWTHRTRLNRASTQAPVSTLWRDAVYDIEWLLSRHEKEKERLTGLVNRVQQMATALQDAVILVDARGHMAWWNTAAQYMFDLRESDIRHKITNLIRLPPFIQYFEDQDYTMPLALTLSRRPTRVEFQVHKFGEGERLVMARDVTRLFKLEQMRKDFVANVSHELRTPLTVIQGYVETLTDMPSTTPGMHKAFNQMDNQCKRMSILINDLITLSRLETDQREIYTTPVPIAPLIATIVQDARSLSGDKQHAIKVTGRPGLAILGNERELHSAISNLVVNAINYSNAGGSVFIDYDRNQFGATIRVRDTGIGIEQQHLARLTERFYRVDPSRSVASGGTGLGLAIVKHVLLRHNAELTVVSKPGEGSQFTCHFPLSVVRDVASTS